MLVLSIPSGGPESDSQSDPHARDLVLPSLRGLCILVVEDDEDTRELVTAIFEQEGALVLAAGSAAEARSFFAGDEPIDLLVSDIGMPGEDGYALMAAVRAMPGAAGATPAIALTAYSSKGDKAAALESGFDAHMGKPMDMDALVELAARLVRSARDAR